jgi:hypothetical protein
VTAGALLLPQAATATPPTAAAAAVPAGSITVTAPATVPAGGLVTLTGVARPVRPGNAVQVWELRGPRWVAVSTTQQASTGRFSVRVPAGTAGRHTYRAVSATAPGRYDVRSRELVVTTLRSSKPWSTYLADVTPVASDLFQMDPTPAPLIVEPLRFGTTTYAKTLHTSYRRLSFALGGDARRVSTAIALLPFGRDGMLFQGSRMVEVRVDGVLRLRRSVLDGQTVPFSLDVRGARDLTVRSEWNTERGAASDLVIVTPVLTSVAAPERGVDAGTALSELRPVASSGGVRTKALVVNGKALLGGSVTLSGGSEAGLSGAVEYELGGAHRLLTGVAVVGGETIPELTGSVRVIGDGVLLATVPATAAATTRVSVPVAGVQRLRLELVADAPPGDLGWIYSWYVGLADPRLL